MKAICPNNKEHNVFITVTHIAQDWKVDEHGNYLEVAEDCTNVIYYPHRDNSWTCDICGAEAIIED